jgi:putative acetyltransferase
MSIRPFEESDYKAILEIYSKSKLDELINESKKFKLLPLDEDPKRLAELKESDIYVYEDGGTLGYGAIFGAEIRALFVHPSGRGKGLGKHLLEYMLSKVEGAATLYLAKTNDNAKGLYEKFGFTVVDEFETEYNGLSVFANKMVRTIGNG